MINRVNNHQFPLPVFFVLFRSTFEQNLTFCGVVHLCSVSLLLYY